MVIHTRLSSAKILKWLSLCLFILLVFVPLITLFISAIQYAPEHLKELTALLIPTERRLLLLVHSLGLAFAVSVGGLTIGILAATLLWRCETGILSYLRWLIFIFTPVPPYIHALSWSSSMQTINTLIVNAGLSPIIFQGWIAAWWVQLMSLLPLAVGLVLMGMKSIEPILLDSARILKSNIRSFLRIILPLSTPMLLAGGGILFLLSIMDYSVPYLFQSNVYSLEIFAEFSASNEPARAFLYSLPLLLIAVIIVALSQQGLRNITQSTAWRKPSWQTAPAWPRWFWVLQWLAIIIVILQMVVPLVSLSTTVGTWQNLKNSVTSAEKEIIYTLWIGFIAALLCLPLAAGAAVKLSRQPKWGWLWWIIVLLPLAIPPPLVGIGLITLVNKPMIIDIYGTTLMPALAALVRFTSFAVLILTVQLQYIDRLIIDAAHIIQPSRFKIWFKVWLPMVIPGIMAAAGITLALTTGELGATLLVAPPGQATLTMRIYNFLHYGASNSVAGLCLVMAGIALLAGLVAIGMLTWWSRLSLKQENSL
jgi:iron(III) transport system permease protein